MDWWHAREPLDPASSFDRLDCKGRPVGPVTTMPSCSQNLDPLVAFFGNAWRFVLGALAATKAFVIQRRSDQKAGSSPLGID